MNVGRLYYLAQESLRILASKVQDLKPEKRMLLKAKIIDFQPGIGGGRFTTSYMPLERLDWSTAIHGMIENEIKVLPIFKEIVNTIVEQHGEVFPEDVNRPNQAEFWLNNFVYKVLSEKLEGKLTDESLIDYVTTFSAELDSSPIEHHMITYLAGIYLKEDAVDLHGKVLLRKPRGDDLEYEFDPFLPHFERYRFPPSAIMEIQMRPKKELELYEKLNEMMTLLRLFRLGAVRQLWYKHSKKSVMWLDGNGIGLQGEIFRGAYPHYVLNEEETPSLKQFISIFAPLIQIKPVEKTSIGWIVALSRYNSALLEKMEAERKLMTAVMGLESLYSIPSDRGEIEYRLSLRTAKLLGLLTFDSMDVKKNAAHAYKIRNKVTHGLILTEDEMKEIPSLLKKILEYLRISLIIFIKAGAKNKNELLVHIDNSLISQSHFEELKRKVTELLVQVPKESLLTS